jgi:glycosyltransferase involved in cell wall biosynthesis
MHELEVIATVEFTLVIWGIHDWNWPTAGRARYFAESIAKLYKNVQVFYVNPPIQHKVPFHHREFWLTWQRAKRVPIEQHNGVTVLNIPPAPLPYAHHFTVFRLWRAAFIGNRLRRYLDSDRIVFIVSDPKEWVLAHWWKKKGFIVVYDCADLMPAFQNSGERIALEEARLARFVSLITCSAQGLVEHLKSLAPDKPVKLIRNGVNWDIFQGGFSVPPSLKPIPHPRLGFVGSVSYWVDIELIAQIAKNYPEWNFVFIGPSRVSIPNLPNIHLLPPVPPEEVPRYVHGFNVGIIPFHNTPLTRCVNPLKLYEYLACGKPVVATPYGDFGDVEQWVYFARTPEEFADAVQRALKDDCPHFQNQRREAARLASWEGRAKQLFTAIQAATNCPVDPSKSDERIDHTY